MLSRSAAPASGPSTKAHWIDGPVGNAEICAVVTTYRPDDTLPERIERVRPQVGLVVIIDDGACFENVRKLTAWFHGLADVLVHHNSGNVGIATSLNAGVALARERGYRWVLTLDDDTVVAPGMVASLRAGWERLRGHATPAIIGLSWAEERSGFQKKAEEGAFQFRAKRAVITSGSLMSLEAFEVVGSFADDYFIDAVDYEYCLRARSKGFSVIRFAEAGFIHRLGRPRRSKLGPFEAWTYNYGPSRYYYGFRNNIANLRRYGLRDPLYGCAVAYWIAKTFCQVFILEKDRRLKARLMFRGLWDAVVGRMGKTIANE
jgi:rhamnosyltransferase